MSPSPTTPNPTCAPWWRPPRPSFYGFDLDLLRPIGDAHRAHGGRRGAAARARGLADQDHLQRVRPHPDPASLVTRHQRNRGGHMETGHMETVRYGARTEQVNREIEATKADIWSEAVTAVYETDPEIIAAVLPPPLVPGSRPARAHHDHPGGDAGPARRSARAGSACRPATTDRLGRVPDLHADDDRAVAHRRPRGQRRAQEAGRGGGDPRRRRRSSARIARMGYGDLRDHRAGQRDPGQLRAGEDATSGSSSHPRAKRPASSTRTRSSSTARRPSGPASTRASRATSS